MARLTIRTIVAPETKSVGVKRVRAPDGRYANTVFSDSPTLSSDLGYVFRSNVKKVSKKR